MSAVRLSWLVLFYSSLEISYGFRPSGFSVTCSEQSEDS